MSGWIKLHRDLTDHWIWTMREPDKGFAWIDLLFLAAHKPVSFLLKGNKIDLKKGQLAYSKRSLCDRWCWSRGKLERFVNLLKNEHMIDIETGPLTSIITICNYNKYQPTYETDRTTDRTTDRAIDGTTTGPLTDTIQECKEPKELNKTTVVTTESSTNVATTDNSQHSFGSKRVRSIARFEEFWTNYPKKTNRKGSLEIWNRKKLNDKADDLIFDVCWRKENCYKWAGGYIPNPTTYLNQERWNDERITNEIAIQRKLVPAPKTFLSAPDMVRQAYEKKFNGK